MKIEDLEMIVDRIMQGRCIVCGRPLWEEFPAGWSVPLCKRCRVAFYEYKVNKKLKEVRGDGRKKREA